ncbi:MAG TPA: sulfur oxidation c-type cytochrome SoxX [Burkholderiales bacterium]|nr:sulfur oxidation c-type cytochrome SoxX [Burkholderiales bacterium]
MLPVLSGLAGTASAQNNGRAPDPAVCADTANPPKDVLTQGGCVAIERAKGNCDACHAVPGAASSNIGPPLAGVSRQLSDSDLRARIQNPERFNPRTVMPPYGKHEILTPEEIDKLIAWLKTL